MGGRWATGREVGNRESEGKEGRKEGKGTEQGGLGGRVKGWD